MVGDVSPPKAGRLSTADWDMCCLLASLASLNRKRKHYRNCSLAIGDRLGSFSSEGTPFSPTYLVCGAEEFKMLDFTSPLVLVPNGS